MWWPVVLNAAFAAFGGRRLRRFGRFGSALNVLLMADIGRHKAVPGANDNLSGVATLHALAARLRDRPVRGLRVLLVSAGAEEALQEGIRGFARVHFGALARDRTWFLNVDTVGSGQLVLLEGEGPIRMHDYDAGFKSLVRACAQQAGIGLAAGLRARNSTDGIVPSQAGYPTATIVSVDRRKLMPHYHLDSDIPEHLDYPGIADAVRLVEAVARNLAG
jgi:Zn-dependent M28 family amino/carboxypeptidase